MTVIYQNCSVLYCVLKHLDEQFLQFSGLGFVMPITLRVDSPVVCVVCV